MKTPLPVDAPTVPCRVAADAWFPDAGDNGSGQRIAKHLCRTRCPIRAQCAEWGIRHEAVGIWGGLGPGERKKIRSDRGIVLETPAMGVAYPGKVGPPLTTPEHGSEAGYARHKRRGEKACDSCKSALLRARQDRAKRQAAS